jgi:hypothetical protein
VETARYLVQVTEVVEGGTEHREFTDFERLFVDMPAPYSRRLRNLQAYIRFNISNRHNSLMFNLWLAFDMIYTNTKRASSAPGLLLHLLLPFLALASLVLFASSTSHHHHHHHHHHHQEDSGYDENDARVTMVLLYIFPGVPILVPQPLHNLMSFYNRRSKPTLLMRISALMGLSSFFFTSVST